MVCRILIIVLLAEFTAMPCLAEFRDPTQPAYPMLSPSPTAANAVGGDFALVLSAILISAKSRRATINGVSAKQGETIVIEQTASTVNPEPANTATSSDKQNESLNTTMKSALSLSNAGTNPPALRNMTAPLGNPLGNIIAPLVASAIKSMDIPQLQKPRSMNSSAGTPQQSDSVQHPTAHIPARSSSIKIISIHKNSVTIEQNGELKTLQLVQRPYKTHQISSIH